MKRVFAIFTVVCLLLCMTACKKQDSSIGIIGGADGPTTVYVTE